MMVMMMVMVRVVGMVMVTMVKCFATESSNRYVPTRLAAILVAELH